jgi:hypothetical protein
MYCLWPQPRPLQRPVERGRSMHAAAAVSAAQGAATLTVLR